MKSLLYLLILFSTPAFASSIGSETTVGSKYISEHVSYRGVHAYKNKNLDTQTKDQEAPPPPKSLFGEMSSPGEQPRPEPVPKELSWNLNYSFTRNTNEDKLLTTDLSGGLGYLNRWEMGSDFYFSSTPAESLMAFGPDLFIGYRFYMTDIPLKRRGVKDPDDPGYFPYFGIRSTGTFTRYIESYRTSVPSTSPSAIRGKGRFVGAPEEISYKKQMITQETVDLVMTFAPIDWFSISTGYQQGFYDRNVNTFYDTIQSFYSLKTRPSEFSTTVMGFSSQVWRMEMTLRPSTDWAFTPEYQMMTNAGNYQLSHYYKAMLSHDMQSNWNAGLGLSHDTSSNHNFGFLSLGRSF